MRKTTQGIQGVGGLYSFFMIQFRDVGLINEAKQKWKGGLTQSGKVVDYLGELKAVLLQLGYSQDSDIVMDQALMGLKQLI
jgi:hypothetical protein